VDLCGAGRQAEEREQALRPQCPTPLTHSLHHKHATAWRCAARTVGRHHRLLTACGHARRPPDSLATPGNNLQLCLQQVRSGRGRGGGSARAARALASRRSVSRSSRMLLALLVTSSRYRPCQSRAAAGGSLSGPAASGRCLDPPSLRARRTARRPSSRRAKQAIPSRGRTTRWLTR